MEVETLVTLKQSNTKNEESTLHPTGVDPENQKTRGLDILPSSSDDDGITSSSQSSDVPESGLPMKILPDTIIYLEVQGNAMFESITAPVLTIIQLPPTTGNNSSSVLSQNLQDLQLSMPVTPFVLQKLPPKDHMNDIPDLKNDSNHIKFSPDMSIVGNSLVEVKMNPMEKARLVMMGRKGDKRSESPVENDSSVIEADDTNDAVPKRKLVVKIKNPYAKPTPKTKTKTPENPTKNCAKHPLEKKKVTKKQTVAAHAARKLPINKADQKSVPPEATLSPQKKCADPMMARKLEAHRTKATKEKEPTVQEGKFEYLLKKDWDDLVVVDDEKKETCDF
jgi:hypothetical protein